MSENGKVRLIIAGGGDRGTTYARLAAMLPNVEIVGVAEPREFHRNRLATKHSIPAENVHVIYLPEGRGRVAFGGRLIEDRSS